MLSNSARWLSDSGIARVTMSTSIETHSTSAGTSSSTQGTSRMAVARIEVPAGWNSPR